MHSRYRGNRKAMQNWMLSERHKHSGAHENVLCVNGYLYIFARHNAMLQMWFVRGCVFVCELRASEGNDVGQLHRLYLKSSGEFNVLSHNLLIFFSGRGLKCVPRFMVMGMSESLINKSPTMFFESPKDTCPNTPHGTFPKSVYFHLPVSMW